MFRLPGQLWALALAGSLVWCVSAKAEDSAAPAAATSTSSGLTKTLKDHLGISYLAWLYGPTLESASGWNPTDRSTTNLYLEHYFGTSWKLNDKMKLRFTVLAQQFIDEVPDQTKPSFQFADPYFTLTRAGIYKNEALAFNIDGYIRYYVPISRTAVNAKNNGFYRAEFPSRDYKYGAFRFLVAPNKDFFDGKISFSPTFFFNVPIPGSTSERVANQTNYVNSNPKADASAITTDREDFYFVFDPVLSYNFTDKFSLYIEYTPGYLRHATNGRWTSSNNLSEGEYASFGANWSPTPKIAVNPYFTWGEWGSEGPTIFRGLSKTQFAVSASYVFL